MNDLNPCPLLPGSAVWVYLRDSGGEKQDLYSQRKTVLEYCDKYQLRIERVFEDAARSGGSVVGREEFEAMVDIAQANKKPVVAGLVCWDMARFSRSIDDAPFYRRLLERQGYKIVFLANFIPEGLPGQIIKTGYDIANAVLREKISDDSRRGLDQLFAMAVQRGIPFWAGRVPRCFIGQQYPTGRKLNDGTEHTAQILVPDRATWHLGQMVFQLRAERRTYEEIVEATGLFNEIRYGRKNTGVANPMKGKSAETRVGSFLRQTIYRGTLTRKGQEYPNYVEAMVDPDLWQAANSYRYYRGQPFYSVPHPKSGRTQYLLSGLVKCGACGGVMYGVHSPNRRRERIYHNYYYKCQTKSYDRDRCQGGQVSVTRVDGPVMAFLLDEVLTVDFIDQLWQDVRANWKRDDALDLEITRRRAEVADLQARIKNLRAQIEGGDSQAWAWYRERETQLREAKHRLDQLEASRPPEPPHISREAIEAAAARLQQMARSELIRERQLVLQAVIEHIDLWRDRAVVHYKVLDNLAGVCYNMPWGTLTKSQEIMLT